MHTCVRMGVHVCVCGFSRPSHVVSVRIPLTPLQSMERSFIQGWSERLMRTVLYCEEKGKLLAKLMVSSESIQPDLMDRRGEAAGEAYGGNQIKGCKKVEVNSERQKQTNSIQSKLVIDSLQLGKLCLISKVLSVYRNDRTPPPPPPPLSCLCVTIPDPQARHPSAPAPSPPFPSGDRFLVLLAVCSQCGQVCLLCDHKVHRLKIHRYDSTALRSHESAMTKQGVTASRSKRVQSVHSVFTTCSQRLH